MAAPPLKSVQVIVVGAGLSGLRAANDIKDAGLSYMVLEAMNRVGGRTLSVVASPSGTAKVDLGAAWINDTYQSEMYGLANKYGFDLVEQRAEGASIFEDSQGNYAAIPYGLPPASGAEQMEEMQKVMFRITEYVDRVDLEHPESCPNAAQLDGMTALQLIEMVSKSELSRGLVTALSRSTLGVDPTELSALSLVQVIKSASGLSNMISETKNGAQYLRNRQGNQAFSERLAGELDPDCVKLSTPVANITQTDNGCMVETRDGDRYHAEKVIVSVPMHMYRQIQFEPALPATKKKLCDSVKPGSMSKTILVYHKPWWHAAGLSGAYTGQDGPVTFTRDTSVPEDGQYSITCFHCGKPGRDWSKLPPKERKKATVRQLNTAFGTMAKDIPEPTNIIEKIWPQDPWTLGAPSTVMPPGLLTSEAGQSVRKSYGNIHFIGTETSVSWIGYMEGAVRSGIRGASEVINEFKGKGSVSESQGAAYKLPNSMSHQVSLTT